MCGIFFSCNLGNFHPPSAIVTERLTNRGPDCIQTVTRSSNNKPSSCIGTLSPNWALTAVSSVLSLRGDGIVRQPVEDLYADPPSGSFLCWNGEAWKIGGAPILGSDANAVFDLLMQSTTTCRTTPGENGFSIHENLELTLQATISAIGSISGPYAFVFYDALNRRVFYGRDALGRRSMLINKQAEGCIEICSVSDEQSLEDWVEVEADGLNLIDLNSNHEANLEQGEQSGLRKPSPLSVHIPWVVAAHCSRSLNVLRSPFPEFNRANKPPLPPTLTLASPAVDGLARRLQESLLLRIRAAPTARGGKHDLDLVAILFSGGLDCALLARMMHDIMPQEQEIDLLNVAFENPRVIQAAAKATPYSLGAGSPYSSCPDRITGLSSYMELTRICPGRKWRFIAVDVPYAETLGHRSTIESLIHPHNTEMDLSIASALYFAARGSGRTGDHDAGFEMPYTTPARVLFSGLGADELFGGYTRHATAFSRRGFPGLIDELELDFHRLGKRNLGRDDRVISDLGKEVRYPYLDEDLVSWALDLPVWEKCGFGGSDGLGWDEGPVLDPSKRLLRLLAWKLGLRNAATEKKRAIQFGARTAKMEGGRTKGTQALKRSSDTLTRTS